MGYHAVSRERNFHLCLHKRFGRWVNDPAEIYEAISSRLRDCKDVLIEDLFWERDEKELRHEMLSSVTYSRMKELNESPPSACDLSDWSGVLTTWEAQNLKKYEKMWIERYSDLADAVFVLNQNPEKHKSWSWRESERAHAKIPTLFLVLITIALAPFDLYIYICVYTYFIYI